MFRRFQIFIAAGIALTFLLSPVSAFAWGNNTNKLIVNRAIDTLPPDLRGFFDANRAILLQHVNDPSANAEKTPAERRNQFLFLDKYGRFPFELLPRSYKAAVTKFGKSKLESNGLLPWQIGVYSQKLTEDLRAGRWEQAKMDAAFLANYVAETHDPFNTTENFDGRLTQQNGINDRFNSGLIVRYGSFFPMSTPDALTSRFEIRSFGTALVDRYSSFFFMHPNDAIFIADPTDHAFEACLSSHSWLETILYADRDARRGLNAYTDEYYDHFYNQAGAVLIRQISDASTDVGSYWLTAWKNAGQPQLPR